MLSGQALFQKINRYVLKNKHGEWHENQRHKDGHIDKYSRTTAVNRLRYGKAIALKQTAINAGTWIKKTHQRKERDQGGCCLNVRKDTLQVKRCYHRFHGNGHCNIVEEIGQQEANKVQRNQEEIFTHSSKYRP